MNSTDNSGHSGGPVGTGHSGGPVGTESLKILLDLPSTSPALGFEDYAKALAEVIQESAPQFAIGIFGGWGSGKTTLMQAIEARLDSAIVIPVRFSAWRYEKEANLLVPLLDVIREALIDWAETQQSGRDLARKTALTIGRVISSLLAGISFKIGIPGAYELTYKANDALVRAEQIDKAVAEEEVPRSTYHAGFRALTCAFREFAGQDPRRRIVVFIDDLDRCLPQGALEVLESMKLFFDIEGFVFVVGLDRAVIEWSIDAKYQAQSGAAPLPGSTAFRVRGADYIKKIFQIPFQLRPVAVTQVDQFLDAMIRENQLHDVQRKDLTSVLRAHLPYLVTDPGLNPREVKRYINSYTLLRKINPGLDGNIVLALQTIAFRRDWEPINSWIHGWRQVFIQALHDRVEKGKQTALENLDPEMKAIPGKFLEYVSKGRPGNPLLHVTDLESYIYSGEAIRSVAPAALGTLILNLTRIKVLLSLLMSIDDPDDDRGKFEGISQAIEKKLDTARADINRLDQLYTTASATAKLDQFRIDLQRVYELSQTTSYQKFDRSNWLMAGEKFLDEAIGPLRDLYQTGQVGL